MSHVVTWYRGQSRDPWSEGPCPGVILIYGPHRWTLRGWSLGSVPCPVTISRADWGPLYYLTHVLWTLDDETGTDLLLLFTPFPLTEMFQAMCNWSILILVFVNRSFALVLHVSCSKCLYHQTMFIGTIYFAADTSWWNLRFYNHHTVFLCHLKLVNTYTVTRVFSGLFMNASNTLFLLTYTY